MLLVDCEGRLRPLLEHDAALVRQARLLLLEEDGAASRREYDAWYGALRSMLVWRAREPYPMAWARRVMHSAWSRDPLGDRPDCPSYARQRGLSRRELR